MPQRSRSGIPHLARLGIPEDIRCLLLVFGLQYAAAATCRTAATFVSGTSGCPTAAEAVALLLGGNTKLAVSNEVFIGNCDPARNGVSQMGLITDFGLCHHLKDTFTSGKHRLERFLCCITCTPCTSTSMWHSKLAKRFITGKHLQSAALASIAVLKSSPLCTAVCPKSTHPRYVLLTAPLQAQLCYRLARRWLGLMRTTETENLVRSSGVGTKQTNQHALVALEALVGCSPLLLGCSLSSAFDISTHLQKAQLLVLLSKLQAAVIDMLLSSMASSSCGSAAIVKLDC